MDTVMLILTPTFFLFFPKKVGTFSWNSVKVTIYSHHDYLYDKMKDKKQKVE